MSTSHSLPSASTPTGNGPNFNFVQVARTPLIPERVLKNHGAYCVIDTRFRAAARLLQCLWLREHGIATASSDNRAGMPVPSFGSILSPEAASAGKNFLNPDIHRLTLQAWLMSEDDAAIDDERLFGNSLSSMPLVFNLFGGLAADLGLATTVFRRLLPKFVHSVDQIIFEHSPGRRSERFLADRTAWDIAARVTTIEGESATVFIETKYSESMEGPAAQMRDRYNEASRQVRLYRDPDSAILRSVPIEQLWREHMLAQLAVDNAITSRAVFMMIAPRLNRRVQAACRVYQAELIASDPNEQDRVGFTSLALETVIEAIAAAGANDHAHALWGRYCDFDRVYRLAMQELANEAMASAATQPTTGIQNTGKPALPPARRRTSARRQARSGLPTQARTSRSSKKAVR